MDTLSFAALTALFVAFVLLSAFFSAARNGLFTLNRRRLRRLAGRGHRAARLAARLLERPERLLRGLLVGGTLATLGASSVATLLALSLYGKAGIAVVAGVLTLLVLVLAEIVPRSLALARAETVAFTSVYLLKPLLILLYPFVWLTQTATHALWWSFGTRLPAPGSRRQAFGALLSSGGPLPGQETLVAVLDLDRAHVEDLMVPRGDITSVDLNASWDDVVRRIALSRFAHLPAFEGNLDHVRGIINVRKVLGALATGEVDRERLLRILDEPYFVPERTSLYTQLVNFRRQGRSFALVVDEYGDLIGLVTLSQILDNIVDRLALPGANEPLVSEDDGGYLIAGGTAVRDINARLGWRLPADGPKTLNGLIVEYLEDLPQPGTSFLLHGYLVDIVRVRGKTIQLARMRPQTPG